jgi:hypothetical protein
MNFNEAIASAKNYQFIKRPYFCEDQYVRIIRYSKDDVTLSYYLMPLFFEIAEDVQDWEVVE